MLEKVTFEERVTGGAYRRRRAELQDRLMVLQQQAKAVGMGTVVLFEGWGSSGKGARISDLVVNLDPRLYAVHTTEDPVGYESRMPFMARFWSRLGAHGTMTIFDQAYYDALTRAYIEEVRHGDTVPGLDRDARDALRQRARHRISRHMASARAFERQIQADGYLIVRFFLHITAEEQRRRETGLMLDRNTAWKVDERDISQMQHYDEYYAVFDDWLERSAKSGDVWHVIPALHKRNANLQIMQALADEMTDALEARGFDTSQPIPAGDVAHAYRPPVEEPGEEAAPASASESAVPAGEGEGEGASESESKLASGASAQGACDEVEGGERAGDEACPDAGCATQGAAGTAAAAVAACASKDASAADAASDSDAPTHLTAQEVIAALTAVSQGEPVTPEIRATLAAASQKVAQAVATRDGQAAGADEPAPGADGAQEVGAALAADAPKPRPRDIIGSAKHLTSRFNLVEVPSLDDVGYDKKLSDADYSRQLKEEQATLSELSLELYRSRIPLIIAYEGWDAAGKGGNIKRVAAALDARSYVVHPISAPTHDELAHPFLWRFWTDLPRTGHTAIFDRTWYGRVLVERIEGFARPEEWRRAYEEINEFEDDLRTWGAVLVKFWIDVSSDEQLRRFHDRQNDPNRRWKITDEDWRNREKNDLYRRCVNDMLRLTSTEYAPWTVVESDDKHYARVKALKVINRAIRRRLKE